MISNSYTVNIFCNDSYTVDKNHLETAWEQTRSGEAAAGFPAHRPRSALPPFRSHHTVGSHLPCVFTSARYSEEPGANL